MTKWWLVVVCAVWCAGCKPDANRRSVGGKSGPGELLSKVESALRERNPAIDSVAVLSARALVPGGEVAVVGWGTVRTASPPRDSEHGWENELFGVFIFNSSLSEILRTVDMFPTKSWHDYDVRIERFDPESLVVRGTSVDYGGDWDRRAYKR